MSPQTEYLKRNERLWMRPGRLYIPAWQFSGIDYETTTATDLKSIATGAANDTSVVEINTSGVTAVNFTADLNSLSHFMAIPADMDLSLPIYFSVVWTANNTSGSATMAVKYKVFVADTTVLGSAVAAVALDKTIALKNMAGVAFTTMVTTEGRIDGGRLGENTEYLQLDVSRVSVATITTVSFLGLNIRYTRKFLQYGSMKAEAKPNTYIASEKVAVV
jgi:hypothetical protein